MWRALAPCRMALAWRAAAPRPVAAPSGRRGIASTTPKFEAPHAVLGVANNATQDQIRQAFLFLAKKYHPDVNPDPGAHEEFVRVQAAYMKLSKPGTNGETESDTPPHAHDARPETGEWGFDDPRDHWNFSEWYGQKRRGKGSRWDEEEDDEFDFGDDADAEGYDWRDAPPRARKIHRVTLTLTFAEAVQGCSKSVELPNSSRGQRLEVRISPGATSRDEVLINQPRSNVALLVKIKVLGEAIYRSCGGMNIGVIIPITFSQAVLGASVPVPLLNGSTVTVQVPPGTKPGDQLILHGQGLRSVQQRTKQRAKGHLHVTFAVQVPTEDALTDRQRAALLEFRHDEAPNHTPVRPPLNADHRPKHRKEKQRRRHQY